MKKPLQLSLFATLSLSIVTFSFMKNETIKVEQASHLKFTSGSPAARTGAPGELNCTNCHSGTAENGSGINFVTLRENGNAITNYELNKTYTVEFNLSDGGGKNGFQLTALGEDNKAAGTLSSSDATTAITSSGGRQYVNHTGNSTSTKTWTFEWTSPSTDRGTVTFYVASNNSNGNFSNGGDLIRISQHAFGSKANTSNLKLNKTTLTASYSAQTQILSLKSISSITGETAVNLVDLTGKSVYFERLGAVNDSENEFKVLLPSDIKSGIYFVHLNINNNFTSKKIYID